MVARIIAASLCVVGGFTLARADEPLGLTTVEIVIADSDATHYATFQSHNQKLVGNSHGLFMAYLRARNKPYTAQTWRLSRSTDGGRTWVALHEETHATNPPVIETDADGTLYLARPDFADGNA